MSPLSVDVHQNHCALEINRWMQMNAVLMPTVLHIAFVALELQGGNVLCPWDLEHIVKGRYKEINWLS